MEKLNPSFKKEKAGFYAYDLHLTFMSHLL